ncbi:MAG: SDR family oxidoreductase [Sphingomonadaceae bacterium]|nr:SDR family oxidoreductase [Sphingomonadaceae bacterium]
MANDLDFTGRTALVTGAASGIGAACARWLDAHGVKRLVLVDMDDAGLSLLELGCEVEQIIGSVGDADLWERIAPTLVGLDHAVVNAGIGGSGALGEHDLDTWRRVMNVNLDGAFYSMRAAIAAMKASGGGSIVFTSSITGIKPVPGIGAYGVAKAGVAHMARIAAADHANDQIRVNAIAPGGVDTAIWESSEDFRNSVAAHGRDATLKGMAATTPRGSFATPDEIAGNIGYLLSDAAANITGHVLVSDGGYSL